MFVRPLCGDFASVGPLVRRTLVSPARVHLNSRAASAVWQRVATLGLTSAQPQGATSISCSPRRCQSSSSEPPKTEKPADNHHGEALPPPPSFFSSPIGWLKANKAHFKDLFKRYGYLTVATYLTVYVITLAGLYGCVRLGLVQGPDVNAYVNDWMIKKALVGDKHVTVPPKLIDFATAWILTKFTEPIRLAVTIAVMPRVIRRAPPGLLKFFKAGPPPAQAGATAASTVSKAASNAVNEVGKKLQ
jgi:Protein of unknown function (DUF1279)